MFEVVLALSIFLGATAVIGQILRNGGEASIRAQLTSEATIRCEARMNELLSGILPLTTTQNAPFEDDPDWYWTVSILDTGIPYLLEVAVIVQHLDRSGVPNATVRLDRLMKDPVLYEEAALLDDGGL